MKTFIRTMQEFHRLSPSDLEAICIHCLRQLAVLSKEGKHESQRQYYQEIIDICHKEQEENLTRLFQTR